MTEQHSAAHYSILHDPSKPPPAHPSSIVATFHHTVRRFFEINYEASVDFVAEKALRTEWLDTHAWRVAVSVCIDGRVLDYTIAIGLPIGIPEVIRSAGSKISPRVLSYSRRISEMVDKGGCMVINGAEKTMPTMYMLTAHYSMSNPDNASCAAWEHRTTAALDFVKSEAQKFNQAYLGRMVAFPVMIDTDLDAITVVGPNGNLSVYELLDDPRMRNGSSQDFVVARLRAIFPETWEPLAAQTSAYRDAFYHELAERVLCNLSFARDVRASQRPPELILHGERMVLIGRHADWIKEHNSIFLIDDTETRESIHKSFQIALQYTSANVIADAIKANDRDWIVPVVINVPHNGRNRLPMQLYVREICDDLEAHAARIVGDISRWLQIPAHCPLGKPLPGWILSDLPLLASRIKFIMSVSDREDRLYIPFM